MRTVTAFMVVVVVLTGVGYAADDLPFVIGGDGTGGKVSAVAAPACPAGSVFGQECYPTTGDWNGFSSEWSMDWLVENFWGVSEEICGIQWWGVFADSSGNACTEGDPKLYVMLWDGSFNSVANFEVVATRVDTGIDYGPDRLYEFRVTFPVCFNLSSGYISVIGLGDPACWFWWLSSPEGDGQSFYYWSGGTPLDFAMCLLTSPRCPSGSLSSQRPNRFDGAASDADVDLPGEYLAFENFPAGAGSLSGPICDLRWWGTYMDTFHSPCLESQDSFEIKFYEDDGGQPGDELYGYQVVADRQDTGFVLAWGQPARAFPIYEFNVDLPSCCPMTSGWISIRGYGGNTGCWHAWAMSVDGDGVFYRISGSTMYAAAPDLSLCLTAKPDGDGDLVPDDLDDCEGTASGDPVDADGCSTADDDGDGVLNDQDDCASTPRCADVDSDGCPSDADGDGVVDGCDDCPDTASCATNINSRGCARDSDGDGSPDGCPPAAQGCCGAAGPVAPLGLAVGMLLLSRFVRRRR